MKKLLLVGLFAVVGFSASARSSYSDDPSVFEVLFALAFLILLVILVVKFFHLVKDVSVIRNKISPSESVSDSVSDSFDCSTIITILTSARNELDKGNFDEAVDIAQNGMGNASMPEDRQRYKRFIDEVEIRRAKATQ